MSCIGKKEGEKKEKRMNKKNSDDDNEHENIPTLYCSRKNFLNKELVKSRFEGSRKRNQRKKYNRIT